MIALTPLDQRTASRPCREVRLRLPKSGSRVPSVRLFAQAREEEETHARPAVAAAVLALRAGDDLPTRKPRRLPGAQRTYHLGH